MPASVTVDTSELQRDLKKLVDGLSDKEVARAQADDTARAIAQGVPVRSGRLRSTVAVTADGTGFGVTYGAGVPYANYIEHRSNAVAGGVDGAAAAFVDRCTEHARKVASGL